MRKKRKKASALENPSHGEPDSGGASPPVAHSGQALSGKILALLNRQQVNRDAIAEILLMLKEFTGIEAGAIRLCEGDAYPYFAGYGFPHEALAPDGLLCSKDEIGRSFPDPSGHSLPGCLCRSVIAGHVDPSLPFFTDGGSFWTNSLPLLRDSTPEHQHWTRGTTRCSAAGYQSVALIPLRSGDRNIGLLQLNDSRCDRFTLDAIRFLEGLSSSVGIVLTRILYEEALRKVGEALESRVRERTAQLAKVNNRLLKEITDRQRAQEALAVSEARYRALAETAKDIIWTADMDLNYTYVSPSVTAVLGYEVPEIIQLSPLELMTQASGEKVLHAVKEEFALENSGLGTRFASRTEEIEHYAKDGSTRFMEITMTLLRDETARPVGILGISRDVSERKKIEQIKTQFVTNAAHQLRGPLTSVRGYSELLLIRQDLSDTERQNCLERINEEAVKLSHIVTDLVDVSRFESDRGVELELRPTPVDRALMETVERFRRRFEKHRFEIAVPEEPIVASLDAGRFKEILTRVLSNAAQYSPEGGLIRVACTVDGDRCQVSVQDEGLGMTAEQVGKVFDKFYRVDASDTGVGGMGLGMTIVKHLVEWLGGTVRIESEYGKGTTITFSVTAERESTSG